MSVSSTLEVCDCIEAAQHSARQVEFSDAGKGARTGEERTNSGDCPRFNRCGAPVCPLDPRCLHSRHLPGESVCLWLRELSKPGGDGVLRSIVSEEVAATVARVAPGIIASQRTIARALQRASRYGSKLKSGQRMQHAHAGMKAAEHGWA